MNDAQIAQQLGELSGKVDAIDRHLNAVQKDVSDMKAQANRWKGGFIVILAVGGLLGWVADKLWTLFHRAPKGPW